MIQLEMAKEIKRVCGLLHISYFLDSGSLLGAVRHGGFIPWDDDLDMGMLRKDYQIFVKRAPELLDSRFLLQTWYTDEQYGLAFAKLRMKDTIYIEASSQKSQAQNGFYIDIFPYDAYPDDERARHWQSRKYYLYRRAIMVKSGYTPWKSETGLKSIVKEAGYLPIKIFAAAHLRRDMIQTYERCCRAFNKKHTEFLYEQAGAAGYGNWTIPRECFDTFIELPFEDDTFLVPGKYDLYLKSAYGDYMTLPPADQRENRHHILKVQFPGEEIQEDL